MSHNVLLRPDLDRPARALIRNMTGFREEEKEDEENFRLCYDYLSSNLLYHTYFDPVEKSVLAHYQGLKDKLSIHVQREKVGALTELLDRYLDLDVFKEPHPQFDIKIRLLSLLWSLSESPLNAKWSPADPADPEEEEAEVVDWQQILAEGEERWECGPGSDQDLSDWSDVTDPEDDVAAGAQKPRSQSQIPPLQDVNRIQPPLDPILSSAETSDAWLRSQIQPQYWKSNQSVPKIDSSHPSAHFVYQVDREWQRQGVPVPDKTTLTEYQLIRECLWMARHPRPSTVFHMDDESGTFSFVPNVALAGVTPELLAHSFDPFCLLLAQLRTLKDFCSFIFAGQNDSESGLPYTYEAYAGALHEILQLLSSDLLAIEETVSEQKTVFTLLDLFRALDPWLGKVAVLHSCHQMAIEPADSELPRWHKAVKVLSGVYQRLMTTHNRFMYNMILDLFMKTCVPYFRTVGLWLAEGRLEDFKDEFVLSRKEHEESEAFWSEGFEVRNFKEVLEDEGLVLPPIFAKQLPKILVSGKSIEILTLLRKRSDFRFLEDEDSNKHDANLFELFLAGVRRDIKGSSAATSSSDRTDARDPKTTPTQPPPNKTTTSFCDHEKLEMDPYLALAFEEVYKSVQADETDDSATANRHLLLGGNVDPLLPINAILERSLHPLIDVRYQTACASLLKLVRDRLGIEEHLNCVRRVFLLEAGDLMQEFYTDIFRRLRSDVESLDATSMTLFLQDCIGRRYPGECERFTIEIADDVTEENFFSNINLSYDVSWPLNIVLCRESFVKYNQIFLFLLRVKRALWTLQQINSKDLIDSLNGGDADDSSSGDEFKDPEDSISPDETSPMKIHRVFLLRSWLFHFVGNVHSYFMTRVLHSTELELAGKLGDCKDLDEVLETHSNYVGRIYDRCFLNKSARILLEAVNKVLGVCQALMDICCEGVAEVKVDELLALEETYVRSHHFLASTLSSMTQRRNLPHLDGLAAALVYSCPARAPGGPTSS